MWSASRQFVAPSCLWPLKFETCSKQQTVNAAVAAVGGHSWNRCTSRALGATRWQESQSRGEGEPGRVLRGPWEQHNGVWSKKFVKWEEVTLRYVVEKKNKCQAGDHGVCSTGRYPADKITNHFTCLTAWQGIRNDKERSYTASLERHLALSVNAFSWELIDLAAGYLCGDSRSLSLSLSVCSLACCH